MATVTKLPSRKWRIQVRRFRVYKAMTFDRKADALKWGLDLEAAVARGASFGAIKPLVRSSKLSGGNRGFEAT